jgi:hypothetical protein
LVNRDKYYDGHIMKINEISEDNKYSLLRNLTKRKEPTSMDKDALQNEPGIDVDVRAKSNKKTSLKNGKDISLMQGNFDYTDVADTSKNSAVNQFYDEFNSDVTGYGFPCGFYVKFPGSDKESFVAGKTKTKTNNRVVELVLCQTKQPKSLQDKTITMIRAHVGGSDSADRKKIESVLSSNPDIAELKGSTYLDVKFAPADYTQAMNIFWKIVSIIESENISAPGTRSGTGARSLITKPNTPLRYYMGAATILYSAYRFRLPNLISRGGRGDDTSTGIYDVRDDLITIGITKAGREAQMNGESIYREHAVPGDAISKAGLQMYNDMLSGKPMSENDIKAVAKVAQMMKDNLCIVITTPEEAKVLDSQGNTNPMGWTPENNDVLSRFKHFKIPVYSIQDGKRLSESYWKI